MTQDETWKDPDKSKSEWNASLPYPSWPFGAVVPKELAKWARKNVKEANPTEGIEAAPF